MAEKTEIKITRTYSLDPAVIAWVTKKAARFTIENVGERASDSKIVNDLLTAAMEKDIERLPLPIPKPAARRKRSAQTIAA